MPLLIMILPARVWSDEDGAIPMGLYLIDTCRISFNNYERGSEMDGKKLLRYSMQLSMLKQLFSKKLINETEYQIIKKKLMKDYGIVSNITA